MATRDTQAIDTGSRNYAGRDEKFYVVVLSMWVVAASLLLFEIFDIRPASAQTACGDRTEILTKLAKRHSEKPRAMGLSADGKVIEVLVSSTGSWSILVSHPNRQTCLVATGENWESLPAVAAGPSA